jgi:hypothetical protein
MNNNEISVKEADRQVYRAYFDNGLVDIFLSSFVLIWAVAPYLSARLGDFLSSAIFLPVWAVLYLVLLWVHKAYVRPRTGTVKFGISRRKKLSAFTWIMLALNVIFMILGLVAFSNPVGSGYTRMLAFVLMLLVSFSLAGFFLDVTRFYIYGMLWGGGFFVGEWLYQTYGFSHHGYPVVFGTISAIIFLVGIYKLLTFLRRNPLPGDDQLGWEGNNG